MALEEFAPDIESNESSWNSAEKSSEISEKYKEKAKKSAAWIKRTGKDEKKAKKYDFLLYNLLVSIIVDKKYDTIIERIFKTMDYWYTSNFLVWVISLINKNVSNKIREISNKENIVFNYSNTQELRFDDNNLPIEVKSRINYWIEDIIDSLTIEYSNIQNQKIINLLKNDWEVINQYIAIIFIFFLKNINITVSKNEALNISNFIVWEVLNSLKKIKIEEV